MSDNIPKAFIEGNVSQNKGAPMTKEKRGIRATAGQPPAHTSCECFSSFLSSLWGTGGGTTKNVAGLSPRGRTRARRDFGGFELPARTPDSINQIFPKKIQTVRCQSLIWHFPRPLTSEARSRANAGGRKDRSFRLPYRNGSESEMSVAEAERRPGAEQVFRATKATCFFR